ncbi:potassium channel subfamily K member 17 isoform X1 [Struthio camelus]|uniref:potassium channel subfamily K member 17 isoform X1 n=1 Tax=Struthio camelus TaxID=8801 RepID=UPI003603B0E8
MNVFDSSLSLSVQDPSRNPGWGCASCLKGGLPGARGIYQPPPFTPCPLPCPAEGHVQWQAADRLAGGWLLHLLAGGRSRVPGAGEDCREGAENGSCPDEGSFSAELHPPHGGGDGAVYEGYGTLRPKTAGGQIFCVFFALFGIPLNIVFLHRVGKMLSLLCKKLGKFLYEKGMRKKKIKFLTLLFFLVTGILVFLCLPSLFFQITEGWSYSEGIYFAFITLSTIGFGDYVVGKQPNRNYFSYYRTVVAIWILFGLAWIALLFNLLTTILEDTEKIIAKDLHQMGKVNRDSEASQQRRCWHAQFIPEEELQPPHAGGEAQKMESLTAGSEHPKK